MKRETLLGAGLVLAGVAELSWAGIFFARAIPGDLTLATVLFVAGAGILLAAGGALVDDIRKWALWSGLALAAIAHAVVLGIVYAEGWPRLIGAALLVAGLAAAAWGARSNPTYARLGHAAAALGSLAWAFGEMGGDLMFMTGHIFATVGFALAAVYAQD